MQGLFDLHSINVSHRDIKLDNIMLQFNGNVTAKLIDMGCLAQFGTGAMNMSLVGTPAYLAPEVIK